ncbi:transposable element Tcb1 transposase [Trichonephila clavipes]|nr:transposable element Tcb1 transposase [Trichonephila clavipes]
MSTMSQRSHLTDSEAWRVVGRIWNRFLDSGSAGQRPGQGRRQETTPNEDRYLVLTARRHRNMNATHLQQLLRSATGTTVSTQTVQNRLHGVGLYAHRPMVCVRLRHRRERMEWATEHVNWRRNGWSNVLFSDESRFSVHLDNRRIFIWRDHGSRNNPAFVHESVRLGGGGMLVDEILRPIVVPYAPAIGDDFILMDDNCRPHRANLVEDFIFEEGIVRMEWPACSPDMNPIEHVWYALGRRVAGRQPPPQTLQELERALLKEWDRIPQLVINSLIESMPQRWPIYDRKVRGTLIQPACNQPGLVRGTAVLLENSITVRITEQHKRVEVIIYQLYVPNCIEGGCLCFLAQARRVTRWRAFSNGTLVGRRLLNPYGGGGMSVMQSVYRLYDYHLHSTVCLLCPSSMYSCYTPDTDDLESSICLAIMEIEWPNRHSPTTCRRSQASK